VIRSDDGGATNPWQDKTGAPLPSRTCKDVVVDSTDSDRVLAVFGGSTGGAASSVFISTNGGDSWTDISGDLPDGSVNAAVFDPNDANTIYVGTDFGVYRTTDGGVTWQVFDNGIPNVSISDLVVHEADQLLVAATFGRGMYKLSIVPGNVEPPVDLYVRTNLLDTGEKTPAPSGLPNPTDPSDTVGHWESPDIKAEVAPYYAPDALFDGVELDEDVEHDDPHRGQTSRIYLQVHNRGYQSTTDVRARIFFADASAGLPAFPNALTPPDFNLTSTVDWAPIGPAQTIPLLEANRPVILSWDFAIPAGAATHSCFLAVVSSPDDPITTTETDAELLHRNDKRVALKNLHVINAPGPRPASTMVALSFHSSRKLSDFFDVVIQPDQFSEGVIGMLAPPLELRDPDTAFEGVEMVRLREGENLGQWYVKPGDKPGEMPPDLAAELDFTRLYEFDAEKTSAIKGIKVPTGGKLRAVFTVKGTRNVPYDAHQRFLVMQRQEGQLIGGSTFELRLKRARKLHPVSLVRVVLEKVRVLDDSDPCIKGAGELVFNACVAFNDDPCRRHFRRLPHCGHYRISDRPGRNEQIIRQCIFEGFVAEADRMALSILPVEHDLIDPDDVLSRYRRIFNGPPETWIGTYGPGDEGLGDPEAVGDWQVWYRIESLRFS